MRKHHTNAEVVQRGAKCVWGLCIQDDSNQKVLLDAGAALVLKKSLEAFPSNRALCCAVLGALESLCCRYSDAAVALSAVEIFGAICPVLKTHMHDSKLVERLVRFLLSFVQAKGSCSLITNAGMLPMLAHAMHKNATADVQKACCGFCEAMAASGAEGRNVLRKAKFISHIATAMTRHRTLAPLQVEACGALWSLCKNSPENQAVVCSQCLRPIISAMQLHFTHHSVQRNVFGVLAQLAANPETKSVLETEEIVRALLKALATHVSDKVVTQLACTTLASFAASANGYRVLAACETVLAVVSQLQEFENTPPSQDVSSNVRHFTHALTAMGRACPLDLLSADCVPIAVKLFNSHRHFLKTSIAFLELFHVVSTTSVTARACLRDAGVIPLLISGMQRHQTSLIYQEQAVVVLESMGESSYENQRQMFEHGAMRALKEMSRTHASLAPAASRLLARLYEHSSLR
eukprot:c486_g1_i1.p1 GENE.c486_g1_i1~~c486_g1_i1.p1  ORF type:complete len:464 (-),score=93.30 c486_g1_i1:49-1440(-)